MLIVGLKLEFVSGGRMSLFRIVCRFDVIVVRNSDVIGDIVISSLVITVLEMPINIGTVAPFT